MTNDLIPVSTDSIFYFNDHPIRTEMIEGNPYFCGIDICNAISIKNNRNVIARLKYGVHIVDVIDNLGRKQGLSFVSEPNLYKIALQSRKAEAEPFVDWVCKEVLPTLRKTGCYSIAPGVDMKALGGLVKRCCRVSIKEFWIDVVSGKIETFEAIEQTLGWMIKRCTAAAVRQELTNLLAGEKTENWEVSDQDLIYHLYRWHNTKSKAETLAFRQLYAERDALLAEITQLKEKAKQIKVLADSVKL